MFFGDNLKMLPTHHYGTLVGKDLPFEIIPCHETIETRNIIFCSEYYPHRHTFYEVLFYTGGEGTHIIDFESYNHITPVVYFLSPGQVHFWNLTRPLEGYALILKEDFLFLIPGSHGNCLELNFFHCINKKPLLYLNKAQADIISKQIQSIYDEYKLTESNRISMLRALVHVLILKLQRMYNLNETIENDQYGKSTLVKKFVKLVSQTFVNHRSVQYYADILAVSSAHLSDVVKTVTETR